MACASRLCLRLVTVPCPSGHGCVTPKTNAEHAVPEPRCRSSPQPAPVSARPCSKNRSVCFVLLPKRWVVERGFAWAARFRRLAHDYEWLATTLAGLRFLAFACLMLHRFTVLI